MKLLKFKSTAARSFCKQAHPVFDSWAHPVDGLPPGFLSQGGIHRYPMNYWLFKSEPDVFSFADLKARPHGTEPWSGVRNYQARNYMRDNMTVGDLALFYHSSCAEPGIAGVMRIASEPYPDPTQFHPGDDYFDPKATPEKPIWFLVDVAWEKDLKHPVSLNRMREAPALADMLTLRKGNRLSITPVTAAEFKAVLKLSSSTGS